MPPHFLCCLQKNHLSGLKRKLLKVSFYNVQQLMEVRREITPTVNRNSKRSTMADAVAALAQQDAGTSSGRPRVRPPGVMQSVHLEAAVGPLHAAAVTGALLCGTACASTAAGRSS